MTYAIVGMRMHFLSHGTIGLGDQSPRLFKFHISMSWINPVPLLSGQTNNLPNGGGGDI